LFLTEPLELVYSHDTMHTRQNDRSRRVVIPAGPANLRVHLLGPHPILTHFLDRMAYSILRDRTRYDASRLRSTTKEVQTPVA
jgi:hypothetical protein